MLLRHIENQPTFYMKYIVCAFCEIHIWIQYLQITALCFYLHLHSISEIHCLKLQVVE